MGKDIVAPNLFIATMFRSGLIPGSAGGTYGSIVQLIIMAVIYYFNSPEMRIMWCIIMILATILFGWISIPDAIKELKSRIEGDKKSSTGDFNAINIDEAHGMSVSLLPVFVIQPEQWIASMVVSFGLFRLFDIYKPLGIKTFEKFLSTRYNSLSGKTWAIILDDTMAGLCSVVVISAVLLAY